MIKTEIFEEIKNRKPRIVYVSGKTCTGKTTFAQQVHALGYAGVELDTIVRTAVVEVFNVQSPAEAYVTAYTDVGPPSHVTAFIEAVRGDITNKLGSAPVVIEGAIAKARILKEIFSGELSDFYFVYFHPIHFDPYKDRIRTRFIQGVPDNTSGLPMSLWALVDEDDLKEFMRTHELNQGLEDVISTYAKLSMEESKVRLDHFRESFPHIYVVEV